MGRYTSVQALGDPESKMGESKSAPLPKADIKEGESLKPADDEKVYNVKSSVAGANSGQFHVYMQSRARETARLQGMEESTKKEQERLEFAEKLERNQREAEERTRKNAEKRKQKKRKREQAKAAQKEMDKETGKPSEDEQEGNKEEGEGGEEGGG